MSTRDTANIPGVLAEARTTCSPPRNAAFALRINIAVLLARTDYDGIAKLANHAIEVAEASGDHYVLVQILNVLGAVHFDRATSKLREPHARSHLSSLDPFDAAPMEVDAREALVGLGYDVLASIQRLDIGLGFESGLSVVLLAIILDRITESFGASSAQPQASWRERARNLIARRQPSGP